MTKVAFVSFRLKGHDGVSVETEKWIEVFRRWDCQIFRLAGYIPGAEPDDIVVSELNHMDPEIESFTARAFSVKSDRHALRSELALLTESLERRLLPVLAEITPDLIVAENVFSMPLNIPLTMVLRRYLTEENRLCIAHHHDFYWEHEKFARTQLEELMGSQFPPALSQLNHVTVSRHARDQLEKRRGVAAVCVHNRFDFDDSRLKDEFNLEMRRDLGIAEDEMLFLHPTSAAGRKGVSRAAAFVREFAAASGRACRLLVSGPCQEDFESEFAEIVERSGGLVMHKPGWFGRQRRCPASESPYDIADAYACSDMVVFPSSWEGFGNPVMESVVHKKLLLVGDYPVLDELRSFGFQFLSLDEGAVARIMKLIEYRPLIEEITEHNYRIGRRHFSLQGLRDDLTRMAAPLLA